MSWRPNPEDVHDAVDRLIQTQRLKLRREDGSVETQTIPSLWDTLITSGAWTGAGLGGAFRSSPPIATPVFDLRKQIEDVTLDAAEKLADPPAQRIARLKDELRHHNPDDGQGAAALTDQILNRQRRIIPDSLRAVTAHLTDELETETWRKRILGWVAQIKEKLELEPAHPKTVPGVACPNCNATDVQTERDGEKTLVPALSIVWAAPPEDEYRPANIGDDGWLVRAIVCRNTECETAWARGPAMNELVDLILAARETTAA